MPDLPTDHPLLPPPDLPHLLILDGHSPLDHPLLSQPSINFLLPSDPPGTALADGEFSRPLAARAMKPMDTMDTASMEVVSAMSLMNLGSRSRCWLAIFYGVLLTAVCSISVFLC